MRQLTADQVHALKVTELGLDADVIDLTAVEALAAALRRAAGVLCPCAVPTLVRSVTRPLRGLVSAADIPRLKESVEDTIEAMVAYGDLLEHRDIDQELRVEAVSLLYAAPPSFVLRESGAVLLLGIGSSDSAVLPRELETRVEHVNHIRRLRAQKGEDLAGELIQYGLLQRSERKWLNPPTPSTPSRMVAELDTLLDAAVPSREVLGLSLLDSTKPVRYYRGRWVDLKSQSGRFVARRRQAFGADRWCYIALHDGQPERLIDLPLASSRWRGCDEAWRLQLAIDATRGNPQQFRMRPGRVGTHLLELFSPVPMWARRRWDAVGEPTTATGCLFAYTIPDAELGQERRFAQEVLWLSEQR